jgi:hypothetical protein
VSSRTNRILGLKAFRNKGLQDIRRDIYATVGLSYHRFTYWRRKFEDRPAEPGGFALVRCQSGVASHLSVALPNGLVVQGIAADNLAVARQLLESLR